MQAATHSTRLSGPGLSSPDSALTNKSDDKCDNQLGWAWLGPGPGHGKLIISWQEQEFGSRRMLLMETGEQRSLMLPSIFTQYYLEKPASTNEIS